MDMNTLTNALGQVMPVGRHRRPSLPRLSDWSTSAVPDSAWSSQDFMLGAGMVLIQENTHKIVVVHETKKDYWFFPRGRKDVGESLEEAALREAHEESGFRPRFLPLINPTHQPRAPEDDEYASVFNTEPVFMSLISWHPRRRRSGAIERYGGEYLTTWYVGQIEDDAVAETGTGMPDEQDYQSHLLSFEEAKRRVYGVEHRILCYVWSLYVDTLTTIRELERRQAEQTDEAPQVAENAAELPAIQS